jgi:hypothetical protein
MNKRVKLYVHCTQAYSGSMDYSVRLASPGINITLSLGDLSQPLNQDVESTSPAALESSSVRLIQNSVRTSVGEAANPPMVPAACSILT